jgi:hypothetical protein
MIQVMKSLEPQMEALLSQATERERLYVRAIAAWFFREIKSALEYHNQLIAYDSGLQG